MNKIDLIKQPVEKELEEFRRLFEDSLTSTDPLLGEVLAYIKKRSGKMMRPILVMLTAKLFGTLNESTFHAALSLELLHTASLVHDDVVDESDKRRGQSSVNAIYNNKVSVLVGDYMLATSLKHAALTGKVELVELVASLGQELSEGEILQLGNTGKEDFSEQTYFDIIRKKTAALFKASSQSGAVSVEAIQEDVKKAGLLGEMIGIAFQIKDDIFDYFENSELGKPTGNDMLEGKLTLPALYVLNQAGDDSLKETALRIRSLEASKEEIASFVERVKEGGGIEYATRMMYAFRDKALALVPDSADICLKEALTAYIDYVIERNK